MSSLGSEGEKKAQGMAGGLEQIFQVSKTGISQPGEAEAFSGGVGGLYSVQRGLHCGHSGF